MPLILNRRAYARLIEEDVEVLEQLPQSLERDHAIGILRESVKLNYDPIPGTDKRWVDSYRDH